MVGGEDDQGVVREPEAVQGLEQACDLDVHRPDRAIVPGAFMLQVGLDFDPGLGDLSAGGGRIEGYTAGLR